MRTILAIFLMALATQAFGDFNIPQSVLDAEANTSEEVLSPEVIECNKKIEKITLERGRRHREEVSKWVGRYDRTMADLYNLDNELFECKKEYKTLINNVPNNLNMVQIVSRNTGKEGDLNTTLQIVENEFKKLSNSQRLELQLVLKYRGMYFSELDGIWGKDTKLGFLIYLSNDTVKSRAKNPSELFKEVKSGFIIDNLWGREDFEKDLEKDLEEILQIDAEYRQEICRICSSGISSGSSSSSSSRSNSDDDSYEPFFKQMYINNELKSCLKVGNTWDCTLN